MILVFRPSCCAWCQADSNSDLRELATERINHYGTGPDSGIDFGRHLIGIEVASDRPVQLLLTFAALYLRSRRAIENRDLLFNGL